jgi:hypothetical protein
MRRWRGFQMGGRSDLRFPGRATNRLEASLVRPPVVFDLELMVQLRASRMSWAKIARTHPRIDKSDGKNASPAGPESWPLGAYFDRGNTALNVRALAGF